MALRFDCSECGASIVVKYLSKGEAAQCKACGAQVIVPQNASEVGVSNEEHREAQPESGSQPEQLGAPLSSRAEEGGGKAPQLTQCPHCSAKVVLMSDGTCPACGKNTRYVPPDQLPAPEISQASFPFLAILLGVLVSAALGVTLFAASRLVYIYFLYNWLLGVAIGWAIAFGPKQSKYSGTGVLFTITALCSSLAYFVFNVALYFSVLKEAPDESLSFLEFLAVRAEYEPFIGGVEIGSVGNIIVWIVEFGITFYFAWRLVSAAIGVCRIEAVPSPVTEFVAYRLSEGHDVEDVQQELSKRGWTRPEDQQKALRAVDSLVSLAKAAKEDNGNE